MGRGGPSFLDSPVPGVDGNALRQVSAPVCSSPKVCSLFPAKQKQSESLWPATVPDVESRLPAIAHKARTFFEIVSANLPMATKNSSLARSQIRNSDFGLLSAFGFRPSGFLDFLARLAKQVYSSHLMSKDYASGHNGSRRSAAFC